MNLSNSAALQLSTVSVPASGGLRLRQIGDWECLRRRKSQRPGNLALQNSSSSPAPISLTVGGNNSTSEYFGILSGAGSLAINGYGGLILANTSTFTGGTTVSNGVLQFGDGAVGHDGLISGTGGIVNDSTVVFDLYGSETLAQSISGSGSLTSSGSGRLVLTGSNSFGGGTTISAGTLQLGNGTIDGVLSGSGGIANYGSLVSDAAVVQTIGTPIFGTGSLTKIGSGLLTLTAANFYTGNTLISAGTLQLGNGTSGNDGALSGTGGVTDNAVLAFNFPARKSMRTPSAVPGRWSRSAQGASRWRRPITAIRAERGFWRGYSRPPTPALCRATPRRRN